MFSGTGENNMEWSVWLDYGDALVDIVTGTGAVALLYWIVKTKERH